MPLKAIFFDLDGTLLDTAPDFVATLQQLADEYHIPCPSETAIRQSVSDGAKALTRLTFGLEETDTGFAERRQRLLDIYEIHMNQHCQLFDGMYELLEQIEANSLLWGIITNKPYRFTQPIIDGLVLPSPPKVLLCPDHVSQAKPHPEALLLACKQTQCQPQEVLYIGDHKRDIDCGLQAGCETIAVRFGYINPNEAIEHWQAHHIVDHTRDIWPIIRAKL